MPTTRARNLLCAGLLLVLSLATASGQRSSKTSSAKIPPSILLQIIRAEDERRWDDSLKTLLAHTDAQVRKRASLAAGRIGDERAVSVLSDLLLTDGDVEVRQMAAFALGEIEPPGGAYALLEALKGRGGDLADSTVRARAVEALGKITAALASSASATTGQSDAAKTEDDRLKVFKTAILDVLKFEDGRRSRPDRLTVLLGLTAVLRARPEDAGAVVRHFLGYSDPRIVADALNTLARLRLKEGNDEARELLVKHSDPIVRANAARVLGATEDRQALDALLDRALHDSDERVVVSSIRALGSLKDARAAQPLIERGNYLLRLFKMSGRYPIEPRNELLEIATTIGILLKNSRSEEALQFLRAIRAAVAARAPEVEIAFARIAPQFYSSEAATGVRNVTGNAPKFVLGRKQASIAQGLRELATIKTGQALLDASIRETIALQVRTFLACHHDERRTRPLPLRPTSNTMLGAMCIAPETISVPDFLRVYAALKPDDLGVTLRKRLQDKDVIVRATAAELIGELPPDNTNGRTLIEALPEALRDKDLNDAALAILDALGIQKTKDANDAIKTALNSSDHLIRRKAVVLLKANGVGDFSNRIGTVQTLNTVADYRRAMARIGKRVTATVVTGKGSFTIEFLLQDAPLTVDNFIQLARKGFFDGQTIPRVVPNFVVQAGDPRGDQNGGPGYQIRCEINEAPYERAAVGMALSGKDTGGSQWFVTHSPQPHLDGGYTVFGRVVSGMEVVDRIARGDRIRRVIVNER